MNELIERITADIQEELANQRKIQTFSNMTPARAEYHLGKRTGLEYALDVIKVALNKYQIETIEPYDDAL